jgi:cytochrome c-type biogenesis protein CcmH
MRRTLMVSALIAGTLSVCIADERSEALDREATQIYQQVFSPFCPGRSLNDCPSAKATELKTEMRQKLESGTSSEEILKDVFARYGDKYRTVPRFQGVGALVWLVPIGFVVIGLGIAMGVSSSRKKRSLVSTGPDVKNKLSEADLKRIEEELSNLD